MARKRLEERWRDRTGRSKSGKREEIDCQIEGGRERTKRGERARGLVSLGQSGSTTDPSALVREGKLHLATK